MWQLRKKLAAPLRLLNLTSEKLGPPRSFVHSTPEWVERHGEDEKLGPRLIKLYEGSVEVRPLPKTIRSQVHRNFERDREQKSPGTFVVMIPQGRFWGHYGGSTITPDDLLLEDISRDVRTGEDHSVFLQLKLPSVRHLPGMVAALSAAGCENNYFHWMFNLLPKFQLLSKAGIKLSDLSYLLLNMQDLPFQLETLTAAGANLEKVIKADQKLHVKADSLVVPSPPNGTLFDVPPWVCLYLRELFLPSAPLLCAAAEEKKLYVSRKNAAFRQITNEGEVRAVLESHGFQAVTMEGRSVAEQAALFSSASVVVAPHGAALTNLVFCKPDTKVVEIFSPEYMYTMYWGISCQVGLDYYYLIGQGECPPEQMDVPNRYADITVDIAELRQTLKLAEIN